MLTIVCPLCVDIQRVTGICDHGIGVDPVPVVSENGISFQFSVSAGDFFN